MERGLQELRVIQEKSLKCDALLGQYNDKILVHEQHIKETQAESNQLQQQLDVNTFSFNF